MADIERYDAVVIGSGPGGYPCGIRLGQLGLKALVVEKEYTGGVCLNVGCIPSKSLIHAAKMYDKVKHLSDLGISAGEPKLDVAAMQTWKGKVVSKLTGGIKQLIGANKATLMQGEATVISPREVEIKQKDGKTVRVETKNLVLATGSRPIQIPGFTFDGELICDSTHGLAFTEVPKQLVVIGGGYIGLELGTVWAKLGAKVTVVEALPNLLTGIDPDCVKVVEKKLKNWGVEVMLNAKAKSWERKGKKALVTVTTDKGDVTLDADKVLVTVGRRPNTDTSGIDKLGLKMTKGFIETDQQLRTNVPGVYAIGDCAVGIMLAHKATHEGEICAEVIAGKKAANDARTIPAVVFTDPEIASAGLTEEQAKAAGRKVKTGKFPFSVLARALSVADADGFAKVVSDADTEEVLGVHIVGANASDLISEAGLAIEMGAFLHDLSLTIHPHPTMSEALMEASKVALGEAIHVVNR
jgi:dihydrolipoamide dehydrogenase